MDVRPCTELDLDRLREQWPTSADVAGWHFGQQASARTTFLVAWQDATPLGMAVVQWDGPVHPNARAAHADVIEVTHLQVRDEFRNRGIGTAMLAAAESLARTRGYTRIGLGVGRDNPSAARLYARLGYQPTGTFDTYTYSWYDADGVRHPETETSELWDKEVT